MDALDVLLQQLEQIDDDPEARYAAALEVSAMLGSSAPPEPEGQSPLQRELSEDAFAFRVSPADQDRLLARLRAWFTPGDPDLAGAILGAIGQAAPVVGMPHLLSVVQRYGERFDDATAAEAMGALEQLLAFDDDGNPIDEVVQMLHHVSPLPFVLRYRDSFDSELSSASKRLLMRLGTYRHV
jgi:hypothetical protein